MNPLFSFVAVFVILSAFLGAVEANCAGVSHLIALSPPDGTVLDAGTRTITLKWSASPNAASTGCDMKAAFDDITIPSCSRIASNITTMSVYSCSVNISLSTSGKKPWSVSFSSPVSVTSKKITLCVRASMALPGLTSLGASTSSTPTFQWSQPASWGEPCLDGATRSFRLFVTTASGDVRLLGQFNGSVTQFAMATSSVAPLEPGNYSWFVQASNGDALTASAAPQSFIVCNATAPDAPTPTFLVSYATSTPDLTWNFSGVWGQECGVVTGRTFEIYVGQGVAPFNEPTDIIGTTTLTHWVVTSPLPNGVFRARIVAKNAMNIESTSLTVTFAVSAFSNPTAPVAIFPEHNGLVSSSSANASVTFLWHGIDWGSRSNTSFPLNYSISIRGAPFVNVGTNQFYSTTIATVPALTAWIVRADNGQAFSTGSFSFSFCTPTTLSAPANTPIGGTVTDTLLSFQWSYTPRTDCIANSTLGGIAVSYWSTTLGLGYVKVVAPTTTTFKHLPPLPFGSWTWNTRSFSGLLSAQSSNETFNLCQTGPLSVPTIAKPDDVVTVAAGSNFDVVFTIPAAPASYCSMARSVSTTRIFYSLATGNLSNSILCAAAGTNYTCTIPASALLTNGSYAWQIYVSNNFEATWTSVRLFFYGQPCTEPVDSAIPALLSPADGSFVSSGNVVLSWMPSVVGVLCTDLYADRSSKVFIQLKNETNSSSFVTTLMTTNSSVTVPGLVAGQSYTWMVRTYQASGNSLSRSFRVCDPLAVPSVTITAPSGANVPLPVTVTWNQITWNGCGQRTLIVSLDGFTASVDPDSTTYTFDNDLFAGIASGTSRAFTVVVQAIENGLSGTATRAFTFCDPGAPDPTILIAPIDGEYLNTSLTWSPVTYTPQCSGGPLQFRVLVGKTSSTMTLQGTTNAGVTSFSTLNLTTSGVFYWTVETTNGVHTTRQPPAAFSFKLCIQRTPSAFAVLNPAPGSGASNPVTFSWTRTNFGDDCPSSGVVQSGAYVLSLTGGPQDVNVTVAAAQTSITLPSLPTGTYSWWVTKWNSLGSTSTAPSTVHVCSVAAPGPFTLASPSGGVVAAAPITLTWSAPASWGDSCTGSLGLPHNFEVFLGPTGTGPMRFVGETTGTSLTLAPGQVLRGNLTWMVIASNGVLATASDQANFTACTPMPPPETILISPLNARINLPRTLNLTIVPLPLWGETCDAANSGEYLMYAGDPGEVTRDVMARSPAATTIIDGKTGYAIVTATLAIKTWSWTIAGNNTKGLIGTMPTEKIVGICENVAPLPPVISSPAADATVSTTRFELRWNTYNTSAFGSVCSNGTGWKPPPQTIQLMWGTNSASMTLLKDVTFETFVQLPLAPPMPTTLDRAIDLWFQMVSSNGLMETRSAMLHVRTVATDCRDVPCTVNQGECDPISNVCNCFPGFRGLACEISDSAQRTTKIVIGVVVGGVFLLAFIAVGVFFVVRRFYRKNRRIILEPPNFTELRTPPVKMPSFPPDVNVQPDYPLLESALLCENGFDMVWEVFRYTAITEVDGMAKAIVYAYQRHNKSLELLFYLIMREIHETSDESLLFRANSPATKAFKFYSRMVGLPYLFQTLAVLLQGVLRDIEDAEEDQRKKAKKSGAPSAAASGDDEASASSIKLYSAQVDLDPDKLDACSDESINVLSLQLSCQKFLLQIVRSDKNCPGEFKHICAFLRSQLEAKFPHAIYRGLGAFMFLRFYNTAITVPETYGLMPRAPSGTARRQLILLSKVLQNLANGQQFGAKEPFMVKLNGFITNSQQQYERFLDRLCDSSMPMSEPVAIGDEAYQAALATLLAQLYIILKNDPDKIPTLKLPQALQDLILAAQPKDQQQRKRKKKKVIHHAEGEPAPSAAATTDEGAALIQAPATTDIPPPPI